MCNFKYNNVFFKAPLLISSSATTIKKDVSDALGSLDNLMLPRDPPIRGRSRITKHKAKRIDGKENIFESIMRKRQRSEHPSKKAKLVAPEIENVNLSSDNMEIIRKGYMLNDQHMEVASRLLRTQVPHIEGMQDTILGSRLQFDVCHGKFCQILHIGGSHWICVSNIFCDDICDVCIYDSLPCACRQNIQCSCNPNMDVKMQVASILMLDRPHMNLLVENFQRQIGGVDCGLFAIAAATSLYYGKHPSDCLFEQSQMRSHLEKCFCAGQITEFSHKLKQSNKQKAKLCSVPLHCVCRLPDNNEEKMAECSICKEWFHKSCLQVPTEVFDDDSCIWSCRRCQLSSK